MTSNIKGIILAGGKGTRLQPITHVTNKHLLPVYNKPMIFYPIQTLLNAGIKDIMIVSNEEYIGDFQKLCETTNSFECNFSYGTQKGSGGIADALRVAKDFARNHHTAVILGDNIFEDTFQNDVEDFLQNQKEGARIFIKESDEAERYGVAELKDEKVINIEEKPQNPKTNFAVSGLYLYDPQVFEVIEKTTPSARGELEITGVNNWYIQNSTVTACPIKGEWTDSGTFESLYHASRIARSIAQRETP